MMIFLGVFIMQAQKILINWYEYSKLILSIINERNITHKVKTINPIKSLDYKQIAKRPKNSYLSSSKLNKKFSINIPSFKCNLKREIDKIFTNKLL
jgi:dTDP-4-dehydrorhamnose reductase